jgi:DNA integrity scanning protein DisA with diadenylate cyclase activity
MVRIKSPDATITAETEVEYADWMGTKHLSAAESSVREAVLAAVTLSEENGRVTVFEDGEHMDFEREELGGLWRSVG